MSSLTTDGDAECFSLAQGHYSSPVLGRRDPNHFVKGLMRDVEALVELHPVLAPVPMSLRSHFYVCMRYFGKRNDEAGFRRQWKTFIPHITDTDHSQCLHSHTATTTKLLDTTVDAEAVKHLTLLMDSFLEETDRIAHSYETNHLEALNGTPSTSSMND